MTSFNDDTEIKQIITIINWVGFYELIEYHTITKTQLVIKRLRLNGLYINDVIRFEDLTLSPLFMQYFNEIMKRDHHKKRVTS